MTLFLYNMALLTALVAGAPWWLWRMATTQKYRTGLAARLGRVPVWLRNQAATRPVVWLHAVSVGEVLAVGRLVAELDQALSGWQILISTTTRTGQELARQRFGESRVFYCPLDLPWAVRAYMNALQPRMLVLAETEFWPNLLTACYRRGVMVQVVNARISDRSWPRYRALRGLWRPILGKLNLVLAQSKVDSERLRALGCELDRVQVVGNLKFDVRAMQEAEATQVLRGAASGLRFVIAGSTLEGEEAALIETWPKLIAAHPNLVLVLAPRHPERFETVASLLRSAGIKWVRRSEWKTKPPETIEPGTVVLLDTIGELASIYSLATVAFVGGSLVPAGGHNPLEPAQFAVPIVMGPHYVNFRAIVDDLRAHDAIRIASKEELTSVLLSLLADELLAAKLGARAIEVFDAQAGATGRTVEALKLALLEQRGAQ
ncbi:MAG: 3-deoxy-D-manno-octulosonic acid transferase [Acidobacteriota bacterium]|nr:3-deoxy-D-manno-octulosonic acid transferase [Acidobacteriota bacterium]